MLILRSLRIYFVCKIRWWRKLEFSEPMGNVIAKPVRRRVVAISESLHPISAPFYAFSEGIATQV